VYDCLYPCTIGDRLLCTEVECESPTWCVCTWASHVPVVFQERPCETSCELEAFERERLSLNPALCFRTTTCAGTTRGLQGEPKPDARLVAVIGRSGHDGAQSRRGQHRGKSTKTMPVGVSMGCATRCLHSQAFVATPLPLCYRTTTCAGTTRSRQREP